MNATAEAASSAATPVAAATTQANTPIEIPTAAAIPCARPEEADLRTTTAKSGPGDIAPSITTPPKATICAKDVIPQP
ncbi:hypothetical protein GCM10012278_31100 [Nonomuraea glycinis]|uniref:Uncharacterized protein n=1 Tax=Nonomuraea glycinis TaxID=2047744 RepID=A0A918A7E8_9ACTN|nr:hypothetical protein GCM10012278_31100 [Nonomuraea glycinis]